MTAVAQPSFTTGELAPSLHGRVDLARYYTALKTCRNFIIRHTGGATNRAGFRFIIEPFIAGSLAFETLRLIPFEFNTEQAYVLIFGHNVMRVIRNGGLVLYSSGPSMGLPVEVVTPYTAAQLSMLKYTQSNDVMTICHPSVPQQQLSRTAHDAWAFSAFANTEGPFQEINVDDSKTLRASAMTGSVTITSDVSIFSAEMVGQMFYIEQSPESQIRKWEVGKTMTLNDIRKAGSSYYQALTAAETGTVRPDHTDGAAYDGDPGVSWQYLHSGYGIVLLTGFTTDKIMTGTVISRLPDSVVDGAIARTITGVTSGTNPIPEFEGNPAIPGVNAVISCPAHGFSTGNTVTITGVVGAVQVNTTAGIIVIDANSFEFVGVYATGAYVSGGIASRTISGTPTYKWAFEAWGGTQGYPSTTLYHQQRQLFGGATACPQTGWMSRTAGYTDFGTSVPLLDDDAITFSLQSRKMNEIRHFVEIGDLIALTSEGPWVIKKEQGNMVPDVRFQGSGGASHVPPVVVGEDALFITAKGGAIRSLGYFFESDKYKGKDLTITGSHLLRKKTAVSWDYQEVPFSVVWMVLSDGGLLGLTYLPDQDVVGWHRHDTDGAFESVCCIPEGDEDAVYVVVRRVIEGVTHRYVERLASRDLDSDMDAFFVDSGLTYDGRDAGADVTFTLSGGDEWTYQETLTFTTTTDFFTGVSDVGDSIVLQDETGESLRLTILEYTTARIVSVLASRTVPEEFRNIATSGFDLARDTFTGFDHLTGKTVSILTDGNEEASAIVGAVAGGIGFKLAYPATVVHAGLPIVADFETLNINAQGESIQDKVTNIRSVTLIVEDTRGLMAGPDADNLLEISPTMSGEYDQPIESENGTMTANIISSWTDGGRVFIRQTMPLPATILAVIPEVIVGGA